MSGDGDMLQPQPQPTNWGFDHTANGSHVVMISNTVGGTRVDFITPEAAHQMADALKVQAKKCWAAQRGMTDLVVPPQVILGPDGQGIRNVPPSPEVMEAMAKQADEAAEQAAVDEVMGTEERHLHAVPDEDAQEPDSDD